MSEETAVHGILLRFKNYEILGYKQNERYEKAESELKSYYRKKFKQEDDEAAILTGLGKIEKHIRKKFKEKLLGKLPDERHPAFDSGAGTGRNHYGYNQALNEVKQIVEGL